MMKPNESRLSDALSQIDPALIEEAALPTQARTPRARLGRALRIAVPAAAYTAVILAIAIGVGHVATVVPPKEPVGSGQPGQSGQAGSVSIGGQSYSVLDDMIWSDWVKLEQTQPDTEAIPDDAPNEAVPDDAPHAPSCTPETEPLPNDKGWYDRFSTYPTLHGTCIEPLLMQAMEQAGEKPLALWVRDVLPITSLTHEGKSYAEWKQLVEAADRLLGELRDLKEFTDGFEQEELLDDLSFSEEVGALLRELEGRGLKKGEALRKIYENAEIERALRFEGLSAMDRAHSDRNSAVTALLRSLGYEVYRDLGEQGALLFLLREQVDGLAEKLSSTKGLVISLGSKALLTVPSPDDPIPDDPTPETTGEEETTPIGQPPEDTRPTEGTDYPEPETEIAIDTEKPIENPPSDDTTPVHSDIPDVTFHQMWGGMYFGEKLYSFLLAAEEPKGYGLLIIPRSGALQKGYVTEDGMTFALLQKQIEDTYAELNELNEIQSPTAKQIEQIDALKRKATDLEKRYEDLIRGYDERIHLAELLIDFGLEVLHKTDSGVVVKSITIRQLEDLGKQLYAAGVDPDGFLLELT